MRRIGWLLCAGMTAACGDDGGGSVDTGGTTAGDSEGGVDDDGPSTNPSGPGTDPDDTGPATTNDDAPDTSADGPADESTTDEPVEPIDPVALDDDFDDGNLDGWTVLNEQLSTITFEGGALRLAPGAQTVWVDGSTATFVHRAAQGDFKVTAAVTVRGLQNPDAPPPAVYKFGGIMARDPGGGPENHVFIVLGTDDDPSVETKTTTNGSSQWQGPPWPGSSGEIRICRVGATFGMYVRAPGATWELTDTFERADLPAHLDVGPIAYNFDAAADSRASFDFIDFEPVSDASECTE